MSDAPAAPVTENGVPPATQEKIVEETPGFKVRASLCLTWHECTTHLFSLYLLYTGFRWKSCVLYHG